jgi:hypothetical protein
MIQVKDPVCGKEFDELSPNLGDGLMDQAAAVSG